MKAPIPLRDAAVGGSKPASPPIPGTLIVLRRDKDVPQTVLRGDVQYGRIHWALFGKRESLTLRWALMELAPDEGLVPYIRMSPDSKWGVRVDILGEGK